MRNNGFSLAEILITLGVIGIVAAITIPALVNKTDDLAYKSSYKKVFSNASQAVLNANEQGLYVDASTVDDYKDNFYAFMDQFKIAKKCISSNNSECWVSGEKYGLSYASEGRPTYYHLSFIDASGIAWTQFESYDNSILVDTNGSKKPNQFGKDRFAFFLYNKNGSSTGGIPVKVAPFADNNNGVCYSNKCGTEANYYGRSWLFQ